MDLIRDTAFGQIVRVVTKRKYLQYSEEKDPDLWRQWVSEEKSGNAARYGVLEPPEEEEGDEKSDYEKEREKPEGGKNHEQTPADSAATSQTRIPEAENATINETSGVKVDPEKGMDKTVIHFLPNDPGVCCVETLSLITITNAIFRILKIGLLERSTSSPSRSVL